MLALELKTDRKLTTKACFCGRFAPAGAQAQTEIRQLSKLVPLKIKTLYCCFPQLNRCHVLAKLNKGQRQLLRQLLRQLYCPSDANVVPKL